MVRPDAFEGGIHADVSSHLLDGSCRRIASLGEDVRGAELARERLACWVSRQRDDARGPEAFGGDDRAESNRAVADDCHHAPGLHPGADCGVVAGAHHVGEGEKRQHGLVRMTEARDLHERAACQWNANRFALPAVDTTVPERAAVDALRRNPGEAVRTRSVAVGERRDDEIAPGDAAHLRPEILDDADELVPDRAEFVRRVAAVIPEVRAADAAHDDAHDGVGRCGDDGIGSVTDVDPVWSAEDGSFHVAPRVSIGIAANIQPPIVPPRKARVIGVLRVPPTRRDGRVP